MAVLTIFAFIVGMSVQASPSAEALGLAEPAEAARAAMPCPHMAAERPHNPAPRQTPCKGSMLDCVKQMGCIGSPNLPSRCDEVQTPVSYIQVAYWLPAQALPGLSIKPDLFPPIAA